MVIHRYYRMGLNIAETDWAHAKQTRRENWPASLQNRDLIASDKVSRDGAWVADYAQKRCPGGGIGLYLYTQLNANQQAALADSIGGTPFEMADRQRATK